MLKYLLLFLLSTCTTIATKTVTKTISAPCPITTITSNFQQECVSQVNTFRKQMNVKPLKLRKSKTHCTDKEAKLNYKSKQLHTHFGMCGELAQSECKGFQNIENCIYTYLEDVGGSNYELLRNTEFTHLTCGKYKLPYGNGYYYTLNFYNLQSPTSQQLQPTSQQLQPTSQQPQSSTSDCVNYINKFRTSLGLSALNVATQAQIQCANNDAQNDLANGFHNSFGRCQEGGQCECNGYKTVKECIDAYIGEGVQGGHYQILVGAYTSVACGIYNNMFYTQNFYR